MELEIVPGSLRWNQDRGSVCTCMILVQVTMRKVHVTCTWRSGMENSLILCVLMESERRKYTRVLLTLSRFPSSPIRDANRRRPTSYSNILVLCLRIFYRIWIISKLQLKIFWRSWKWYDIVMSKSIDDPTFLLYTISQLFNYGKLVMLSSL